MTEYWRWGHISGFQDPSFVPLCLLSVSLLSAACGLSIQFILLQMYHSLYMLSNLTGAMYHYWWLSVWKPMVEHLPFHPWQWLHWKLLLIFGSNLEYPIIQFWNLLLINTFFSIHNITKLWMCSNNLLFQELHDWMKVFNEHFVCSHFKKTLFTIALWLSCNGKWGLGIFHFQDHFNGKSHFLCISPLNRKNYHCCQWMIPQKT